MTTTKTPRTVKKMDPVNPYIEKVNKDTLAKVAGKINRAGELQTYCDCTTCACGSCACNCSCNACGACYCDCSCSTMDPADLVTSIRAVDLRMGEIMNIVTEIKKMGIRK